MGNKPKPKTIKTLSESFLAIQEPRWKLTTNFHKDVVKSIGVLDQRIRELGGLVNHNAELLNAMIDHQGLREELAKTLKSRKEAATTNKEDSENGDKADKVSNEGSAQESDKD